MTAYANRPNVFATLPRFEVEAWVRMVLAPKRKILACKNLDSGRQPVEHFPEARIALRRQFTLGTSEFYLHD